MAGSGVLVTGAEGGIGGKAVAALAGRGFTVFAGMLDPGKAAAGTGQHPPGLIPVPLDISKPASIASAIAAIDMHLGQDGPLENARLEALVNIAGVNYNAPLESLSEAEIRQMVEVNLLGTILLTRAALPLLRRGQGRIIFTGSATAFLPPPLISVYAATKCALEGLASSLCLELRPLGIAVSIIEPGVVRTPMTAGAPVVLETMLQRMSAADRAVYEKPMRKIVAMSVAKTAGVPPEAVADIIVQALTAPRPKARYCVGGDSKITSLLRYLPHSARDFLLHLTFGL